MDKQQAAGLRVLITLNISWALIALVYDWSKLANIPQSAWLFIAICPLYPTLLALAWHQISKGRDSLLIPFATLPSAAFGVIALAYYPTYQVINGLDWISLLSIPWIWFYATQGWWLIFKYPQSRFGLILAACFVWAGLAVHWQNYSFGFFDTQSWPQDIYNTLFVAAATAVLLILLVAIIQQQRRKHQIMLK